MFVLLYDFFPNYVAFYKKGSQKVRQKKVIKENIHRRLENIILYDKSQEGSQKVRQKKVIKENIHHRLENIILFDKSQEGSQKGYQISHKGKYSSLVGEHFPF